MTLPLASHRWFLIRILIVVVMVFIARKILIEDGYIQNGVLVLTRARHTRAYY